jgi:hypothetical protein
MPTGPLGWDAVSFGDAEQVHLCTRPQAACVWAAYLGERSDADRVAVYGVHVEELTGMRATRRGIVPLPEVFAASAQVVELIEWVEPWAAHPAGYREQLREIPF